MAALKRSVLGGLGVALLASILACGVEANDSEKDDDPSSSKKKATSSKNAKEDEGKAAAPAKPAADPTSWTEAAALGKARSLVSATVLADGRVLVVGGEDTARGMLATVEIYDPETDTFTVAAPLPAARAHHTATLLENGQVLVTGGGKGSEISLPDGNATIDSSLLYDPETDAWTETGAMHSKRAGHKAVRLADGRVLVAGGGAEVGYPCTAKPCTVAASLATAEIYDPTSRAWTATGSLTEARIAHSLDRLPSGKVVAVGGAAENHGLASMEIFDPTTGVWESGPSMKQQRLFHAATVANGRLVVIGGKLANVTPLETSEWIDEGGSAWAEGSKLGEPRTGAQMITLQSGHALVVGGNNQKGSAHLAEALTYDAEADVWTAMAPLASARFGHAVVRLNDGSVLVVGGRTASGVTASVERSQ